MHYLLKNIKKIMLAFIVLSMIVGQMEIFGDVYAKELEKINDQSPYGELYNTDINNVNNEDAVIMMMLLMVTVFLILNQQVFISL